jgi:hypothetical protein
MAQDERDGKLWIEMLLEEELEEFPLVVGRGEILIDSRSRIVGRMIS